MENRDNKEIVKEMNECVGDKVEKTGEKMSVKNSAMTRVSCGSRTRDVVISAMDTCAIYTSLEE